MAYSPEDDYGQPPPDIGGVHELARQLGAARMPPHSLEAEQAVLGCLLVATSEGFDRISDTIAESDFYEYHHRLIYRAISAIVTSNGNCDVVTVVSWLDEHGLLEDAQGLNYVGALPEVTPSAANIKAYAGIVRERSVMRQLIKVATEIADSAFDPGGRSSKELLDEAETKVFGIADQTAASSGGFQDIKSVLAGAIERINTLFESDASITGLATGFDDLDEKTSGLQRSDLIIIAGRPSMGKTTFAMNIAEHVALTASAPVAVFSMEMPAEQLGMRLISSLGRVELQKLRTGRLSEQDWPRIASAITLLNQKRSVYIDDTPALSPTDLRARARRLAREHGLSLIVIDYLQLMKGSTTGENRATEISEISRSLKALAKELDIPIIALSQLNRALEQRPDKRPVMSDLRECVTGDTLVSLADGTRRRVDALVGTRPAVLSVGPDGRVRRSVAEAVWEIGEREVRELRLASGRRLRCTAGHRLRGPDGWIAAGELAVGARLAVARTLPARARPVRVPALAAASAARTPARAAASGYGQEDKVGGRVDGPDGGGDGGDGTTRDVLRWERVVSTGAVGRALVYDMSVPGDACYVGNGIVNHNSGAIEQDADVIMFIYRDEVYNPDDEASKGKAEILIRKQRNGPIGSCMLTFLGMYTRFENYSPEIMSGEFS